MLITLTLSGNSSYLTADFFPPLELDQDYVAGLIDLQTYNSIPNIDKRINLFHIGEHTIEIPTGSYEIQHIANFITKEMERLDSTIGLTMKANNKTMKYELRSGKVLKGGKIIKTSKPIYFDRKWSVGPLLGFSESALAVD